MAVQGAFMRGGVARAAVQERRDVRAAERLFAARGLDAVSPPPPWGMEKTSQVLVT
jgi:hypothetical protein